MKQLIHAVLLLAVRLATATSNALARAVHIADTENQLHSSSSCMLRYQYADGRRAIMLCGLDPQIKDRLLVDEACSNIAQQHLDAGAQVNAQDKYGWSALHFAAANGMSEVASCLLQSGAAVDTRDSDQKRTPLMKAAAHGSWRVTKVLLAAGADPTAADGKLHCVHCSKHWSGHAILHHFAIAWLQAIVHLSQGATPLHLAVRNAHSGEAWRVTITTLAAHPLTNLNAIDSSGWTPLMHAARQGDTQTVQLLQAGASARVLDAHGQPAATLAVDADVRSALAEAAVAEIERAHAAWLLQQDDQHSASLNTVVDDSSSCNSISSISSNSEVCASADSGSE
eukprot:743-Heterococcus_DN1.PRE.3